MDDYRKLCALLALMDTGGALIVGPVSPLYEMALQVSGYAARHDLTLKQAAIEMAIAADVGEKIYEQARPWQGPRQ